MTAGRLWTNRQVPRASASGAGPPQAPPRRLRDAHIAARLYVLAILLFLYLPIVVIVVFSFATSPTLSLPIKGFSFEWYRAAFSNPLFAQAFHNSIVAALVTGAVSGCTGLLFALGMMRLRKGPRSKILSVQLLPAVIPLLVIGISLAVFFDAIGITQSIRTAIIGHILITLPFVVLTMNARLETFDFSILDAARDLGASAWRAFWDITFPLIRPAVLGAVLLAMSLSLDEFVVTSFTIGNDLTLPVLIWGMLREGISPVVNALATLILVGTILLAVAATRLTRRRWR
jgi:spermidine/putrescine transport system permease protein